MGTAVMLVSGLAQNLALLLSLAFIYSLSWPYLRRTQRAMRAVITGASFAAMAIAGMLLRVEVAPGVIVDGRVVVVALAGVFNGIGSGLTAGALVGAYRFWLGGVGASAGVGAILTSMLVGAWIHWRWGPRVRDFRAGHFLLLGTTLAVSGLLWTLALPDAELAWLVLSALAIPVTLFYPLGAGFLGLLLAYHQQERQRLVLTEHSLHHSGEAVLWVDPAGRIADANAAAISLCGYSREALRGMCVWQVDESCSADGWAALWKTVRAQNIVRSESTLRTKNGSLVPVEISRAFIEFEGEALLCSFLHDITERKRAEEAAQGLARVAALLTESLDVAAVGERIVESVLPLFGAQSSRVRLLQPDGSLVAIGWRGVAGGEFPPKPVMPPGIGATAQAAAQGRPVWTADVLNDPRFILTDDVRRRIAGSGHRAILAVPLRVRGKIVGTLSIADKADRAFTETEAALLQAFADQAAMALENARLFEESETRRRAAEALADVGRLLSETLDREVVSQRIAESIRTLLGARASCLCRPDPVSEDLVVLALTGDVPPIPPGGLVIKQGRGVSGLAVREGRPVVTSDMLSDPRLADAPEVRAFLEQTACRAALAVPLRVNDAVIGALAVGDRAGRVFDESDVRLAQAFADQAALALENARLYQQEQERRQQLEAVRAVTQQIARELDLPAVLAAIHRHATDLVGGASGVVFLWDESAQVLVPQAWHGLGEWVRGMRLRLGEGCPGIAAQRRAGMIVNDHQHSPHRHPALLDWTQIAATLAEPLLSHDRLLGVVTVNRHQGARPFTRREEEILALFADQAAIAIENARLYAQAQQEIGERRRTEEALRESQRTLEAVVETAPTLIALTEADGRILLFNRACEELTGYRRDEVVGRTIAEMFLPPEWVPVVQRRFADLAAPEVRAPHENPWRTKAGEERLIEWRCTVLQVPGGGRALVLGTGNDVTERKQAEEGLKVRARQQAAVADLGQRALAGSGLQVLINEAVTRIAGTLGVEYCKVLELLPDGDALLLRAGVGWKEGLVGQATVGAGTDSQAGYTLLSNDPVVVEDLGTEARFSGPALLDDHRVVSGMSVVIQGADRPFGVLGAHTTRRRTFSSDDVHFLQAVANVVAAAIARTRAEEALRDSEEKHRMVLENVDEIVYMVAVPEGDPFGGTVRFVSRKVEHIIGYRPEEFVSDPGLWFRLIHPEDLPAVAAQTKAILGGAHDVPREYRIRHKATGEYRWMEDRVTPQFDQAKQVVGIFGVARDVTERKRAEEALRRTADELHSFSRRLVEVQEAERRRLARELHDEIGQGLTGLKLSLEMSARLPADAIGIRLSEAQTVVNDLMARVRELSLGLRPAMLDQLGLLPALLWQFERYTEQTGLQVAFKHTGLEGRRFAPEVETAGYRIIQEALTNVARHSAVNEVTVRVWADEDTLGTQIEDQGIGFDPETVMAAATSGGLAGMRERVSLLNGRLTVESVPGEGTRVTAELPLPGC